MNSQPALRLKVSVALACLLLGWTATSAGCGGSKGVRYGKRVHETPDRAVHGIHSQRLAELMRGLERMRSERLPQAMDPQIEERRRVETISRVANSMAQSAEQIADAASTGPLDEASRQEFVRLAGTLQRDALQIAEDAEDPDGASIDELRARLRAMEAICDQCHERFRISRSSHARD
jgi:cytochrome c556